MSEQNDTAETAGETAAEGVTEPGTETEGMAEPGTETEVAAESGTEVAAEPAGDSAAGQPSASAAPPAPRATRSLRGALRWVAAVAVFAVCGAGTAYGVTRVERTDVPGLATLSDGRWDYPELVRPPLPAGRPAPFADSNKAAAHYADLRQLVLPAPNGATVDEALAKDNGWVKPGTFLAEYAAKEDRDTLAGTFTDRGLRHIAARGWTTPDGTRTRIYLLQFDTGAVAGDVQQRNFFGYDQAPYPLRGAPSTVADSFPARAKVPNVSEEVYVETKPYGAEHVRQAYLVAGDVIGLVVQSRKGGTKAVPFQQTVVLQEQLLG
ncbi:hypothetical protein [Streptomyces sp. NPDC048106]|uniref:hypothetical protein n=1 Tax=Streptomyces sp. NPDC048106 TaxID=3155750 RepID=UPI003452919E